MQAERKSVLLKLARRARIKWILDASRADIDATEHKLHTSSQQSSLIPGSESIQCVLEFLNDLSCSSDEDPLHVDALVSLLPDEEIEIDTLISTPIATYGDIVDPYSSCASPFLAFLQRLRRDASPTTLCVRSLQQFVSKFSAETREQALQSQNPSMKVDTKGSTIATRCEGRWYFYPKVLCSQPAIPSH